MGAVAAATLASQLDGESSQQPPPQQPPLQQQPPAADGGDGGVARPEGWYADGRKVLSSRRWGRDLQ